MVTSTMEFRASSSNLPNPKSVCSTRYCFILVSCLAYTLGLLRGCGFFFFLEGSVDSHQTTWCYIPGDVTLHNHHTRKPQFQPTLTWLLTEGLRHVFRANYL
jgi:hypothetical protein